MATQSEKTSRLQIGPAASPFFPFSVVLQFRWVSPDGKVGRRTAVYGSGNPNGPNWRDSWRWKHYGNTYRYCLITLVRRFARCALPLPRLPVPTCFSVLPGPGG